MLSLQPGLLLDDFFSFCNQRDGEPLFSNFFLTEKSIVFPDIKASETGYCRATSHCFSKNETLQGSVFPLKQTFQAQTVLSWRTVKHSDNCYSVHILASKEPKGTS